MRISVIGGRIFNQKQVVQDLDINVGVSMRLSQ